MGRMSARQVTYAQAGVHLEAAEQFVERIRSAMQRTYGPRVIDRHGMFAGLFRLDYNERLFERNYRRPILAACADGVGSKVLLALEHGRLRGIGVDLVAMNVNDLLTCGAEPLLFLDYLAVHRLEPDRAAELIEGIADGCRQAGCALLGGETAEMPDLYRPGEMDAAGFAVGVVEPHRLLPAAPIEPGDVLIGLASDGVHANGFTLVRRLLRNCPQARLDEPLGEGEPTLLEALLRPTRIYVGAVLSLLRRYRRKRVIKAMAHITGGGLPGNVARIIPDGLCAVIRTRHWPVPAVFRWIQAQGVPRGEMFRVFNMGIGYVLVVRPAFGESVAGHLRRLGERPFRIGHVETGQKRVVLR